MSSIYQTTVSIHPNALRLKIPLVECSNWLQRSLQTDSKSKSTHLLQSLHDLALAGLSHPSPIMLIGLCLPSASQHPPHARLLCTSVTAHILLAVGITSHPSNCPCLLHSHHNIYHNLYRDIYFLITCLQCVSLSEGLLHEHRDHV